MTDQALPKKQKTLKREVAALLLVVLLLLICLWVFFGNSLAGEAVKVLNLPIFTFAGAAFGLDSVVKQWNISNK
jgi:hypothetical protein